MSNKGRPAVLFVPDPRLLADGVENLAIGPAAYCLTDDSAAHSITRLPCPWNDAEAVERAEVECWTDWEPLVGSLGRKLNELNDVNLSLRYWEVVCGPWLLHAVHVLRDRFEQARLALEHDESAVLRVAEVEASRPTLTGAGWYTRTWSDEWNHACMPGVFEELGGEAVAVGGFEPRTATSRLRRSRLDSVFSAPLVESVRLLGRFRSLRRFASTSEGGDLLMVKPSFLDLSDATELVRGCRGLRVVEQRTTDKFEPVTKTSGRRAELANLDASTEHGARVAACLPSILPTSQLEHFADVRERSHDRYGEAPRDCVVDQTFLTWDNAPLLDYVGRCLDAGRKLHVVQNGGGNGYFLTRPEERITQRIADTFSTWGWRSDRYGYEQTPLASPLTSKVTETHKGGSAIVLTDCEPPRYLYRFTNVALASSYPQYRRFLADFLRSLGGQARSSVVYKRYPHDFGWPSAPKELEDLPQRPPGLPDRAVAWHQSARMAVVGYPDTTFLEALAIGVPTICIWPSEIWPVRREARELVEGLFEVGIAFDDALQAAAHVDRHFEDPDCWWDAPDCRRARDRFIDEFGLVSTAWREEWGKWLAGLSTPDQLPE